MYIHRYIGIRSCLCGPFLSLSGHVPHAHLHSPSAPADSICDDLCPARAWSARAPRFAICVRDVRLECARLPIRVRDARLECARPFSFVSATRAWSVRASPFVSVSTLL